MIREKLTLYCVGFLMLFVACQEEDDYHFPSVKLEFLTAVAGEQGTLQRVQTDAGEWFPVLEDRSATKVEAGKQLRIVSNYERVEQAVRLYGVLEAVAPQPKPAEQFEEGIHTEPASVTSLWMGYDYLNLILGVRQRGKHALHFIEEEVTEPDAYGEVTVRLMLYHAIQEEAVSDYQKRAYVSVPLRQYVKEGVRKVIVYFSLQSDKAFDEPYVKPDVETEKQMTYRMEYIPR